MKRTVQILALALVLPIALLGCTQTSEMTSDTQTAGGGVSSDMTTLEIPVEAGTDNAMKLLGAATSPSNTIVENAMAVPNLSNLVEAVSAAGLVETLNGPGPFTVFAPINEAFDRAGATEFEGLSENDITNLQQLLQSHVTEGSVQYGELNPGTQVVMLSGENFPVGSDENDAFAKRIGNADFIVYNIESSNGVIHLINLVLNPQDR